MGEPYETSLVSRITAISFDTSDLVPVTAPETEDEARLRVARNAYYAANLRAGVPEERALFRRMLGDGPAKGDFDLDNGFQITASGQTRGVSSCALVGGEILKMSGLQVPWAGKSYKFGTAVSRIYAWAQSAGIWYPGNVLPEMGDLVIIGTGLREHVAIWISVYDNLSTKGDVVWTVDGGQVDRYHKGKNGVGMQKIAHVGRDLTIKAGGTYWLGDRPLLGSASLAKCFAKGLFGSGVEARRMEATA